MKRAFDINPGDRQHRRNLQAKLRELRTYHGITQPDLGAELSLTHWAISRFELMEPNPQILTIQRYARAIDHRARLDLHDLPDVTGDPAVDLFTRRTKSSDPAAADDAARSLVLAQFLAARAELGISQKSAAEAMGCHPSSLCAIERGETQPLLSTYQRYARALGGKLTVAVVPAPTVDRVAVDKAARGEVAFEKLTDAERAELFRSHVASWPNLTAMRTFRMSHQTVQRWRAKAAA